MTVLGGILSDSPEYYLKVGFTPDQIIPQINTNNQSGSCQKGVEYLLAMGAEDLIVQS